MDDNNIMESVVSYMHKAETYSNYDGTSKKKFVLNNISLMLGKELFDRYSPLFELIIDLIVSISNKDVKLYLQSSKKFCLPLFSSCK